MEHRELNHVGLHVKDVAKSCEFYERVLELQPIPRPAFDFPGAWYCLLYTSPSPRDGLLSRMPSSA